MLYQLYEAQRAMMEPFAEFALAASKMISTEPSLGRIDGGESRP